MAKVIIISSGVMGGEVLDAELIAEGHRVERVATLDNAIAEVESDPADLVVLDGRLLGDDAIAALSRLLAAGRDRPSGQLRSEASLTGVALSQNGVLVYVNTRLEKMLGYPPGEMTGRPAIEFIAPNFRKVVEERGPLRQRGSTSPSHYEIQLQRKNGETVWAELLVGATSLRGKPALLINAIDIHRRKNAEQALAESESRYRLLFNSGNDAVFVYPIDERGIPGRFIEVNDVACRWLGYSREQLLTMSIADLDDPDSLAGLPERMRRLVEKKQILFELELLTRANRRIPVEVGARLFELHGKLAVQAVVRDIGERRAGEKERRSLEEQFRQSQKMEAIGRLAGGVAHDMNNVLAAIMALAAALDDDLPVDDSKKEDVQGILEACRKGRDLTVDLLGFARKGKYLKRPISLNDLVSDVRSILSRTIPRTIAIETDLQNGLALIEGDPGQLNHALMNVCINAVDALKGGRGTIRLTTRNVVLDEDDANRYIGLSPGAYASLEVSDDGVGMSPATLTLAFEPFFTTKPHGRGTGLGLAMVYGAIKNHGGGIWLASEEGRGTDVRIHLPVVAHGRIVEEPLAPSPIRAHQRRGTVMIVDDEPIILKAHRRLFEKLGYTVLVASDGLEAVALFGSRRDEIDFVVLDLIMPEMDGREAFFALREIDPDLRVMISSGFSRQESADELLQAGAVGFLQKPFDLQGLIDALNRIGC